MLADHAQDFGGLLRGERGIGIEQFPGVGEREFEAGGGGFRRSPRARPRADGVPPSRHPLRSCHATRYPHARFGQSASLHRRWRNLAATANRVQRFRARDQGAASSAAAIAGARTQKSPDPGPGRRCTRPGGRQVVPTRRPRRFAAIGARRPDFAGNAANRACHAASSISRAARVQHRPRRRFALAEHVGVAVGGHGLRSHRGEQAFELRAVERGIERERILNPAVGHAMAPAPRRFRSRGNRGPIRGRTGRVHHRHAFVGASTDAMRSVRATSDSTSAADGLQTLLIRALRKRAYRPVAQLAQLVRVEGASASTRYECLVRRYRRARRTGSAN